MKKPQYFKDHKDSNIHRIKIMGAYTIENDKPTIKGLERPNNIDIWFFVKIINDGKIKGRFITQDTHAYLVDIEIQKYYFLVNWKDHHWYYVVNFDDIEDLQLGEYPFVQYPTLGPKNANKIKIAIRKFLKSV